MKLFLCLISIATIECLTDTSKVHSPPKRGASSPDLSSRIKTSLEETILEKLEANEKFITKSVEELKDQLNKIQISLTECRNDVAFTRRNTDIILKKYFHTSCEDLSSAEEHPANKLPVALASPTNARKNSKESLSQSTLITILPPNASKTVKVRCEINTAGSDWTVILDRNSGKVHFNRTYAEYEEGFGDPNTEYYIGNEALHALTTWKKYELRIELEDFLGKEAWAVYKQFSIGSAKEFYTLSIGGYDPKSTTGSEDGFKAHHGMNFSTYDKDNSGKNCATKFGGGGGWWYSTCYNVLGTGTYRDKEGNAYGGISFWPWHDIKKSLKKFKLLMKPSQ